MYQYKSPSIDKFTTAFFKNCWDIINEDLKIFRKCFPASEASTVMTTIIALVSERLKFKRLRIFQLLV